MELGKKSDEDNTFDLERENEKIEESEESSDGNEEENTVDGNEEENAENATDSNEEENAVSPLTEPRNRRAPRWMNDYVSGDGLSDEEEEVQTHLVLFSHV